MKPHIDPIILVEGKYDKIKLESLVDALIIPTDGFGIFKNKALKDNIKALAAAHGAIILTDSDRAGFLIRKYLHDLLQKCSVTDVYVPDIYGKEKRKSVASAEGKLGVEGMPPEILQRLLRALQGNAPKTGEAIVSADLYEMGLFGTTDSAARRRELQNRLMLPGRLNKNMLLRVLNARFTKEEFVRFYKSL